MRDPHRGEKYDSLSSLCFLEAVLGRVLTQASGDSSVAVSFRF